MEEPTRILVLDDDPHLLRLASQLLRQAGYEVLEATTGAEGLQLAREEKPDLILLDVVLPDTNGLEVCRLVKADSALTGTRVLLISGLKVASDSQAEGLECGADGYIVRPISNRELLARVEAMLRIRQAEAQRDAALEALRESDERFKLFMAHVPAAVSITDLDDRLVYANERFAEMVGQSPKDLVGRPSREYTPPELLPQYKAENQAVLTEGQTLESERIFPGPAGPTHQLTIKFPMYQQRVPAFVGEIGLDVTEYQEAQKQLEYQARLLANVSEAVIATDIGFRVKSWNRAAQAIYGWRADEVLDQPVGNILETEYPDHDPEQVRAEVLGKGRWCGEVIQRRRDGTAIHILASVTLLQDDKDQPSGTVAINRDITGRKQAETAFKERVKKLNCLYGISALVERPNISLAEILTGTVSLIPPAWQYPKVTCARILLDGREYQSANFQATAWKLARDIVIHGEPAGAVEVYYLEEQPECDEGPFFEEERNLINAIAERLGRIVERIQTEEKLYESEEALRTLVEANPQAALLLDTDGVVLAAGRVAAQRLDEDVSEVVGACIYDLLSPDVAHKRKQMVEQAIRTGKQVRFQDLRSGRHIDNYIQPILDSEGKVTRLSILGVDITERKQAEIQRKIMLQALRESEERFRMTVQLSPIGIGFVDSAGDLIDCNTALAAMVGYRREELLDLNFADFTHADDLKREWELIQGLWAEQTTEYRMEKRYIHKEGHTVWVDVAASLFKDESGGLAFGFAFVQDITARKEAERIAQARLQIAEAAATRSSREIMRMTLDEIEALTGSEIGFYHLLLADQETLALQVWSTNTRETMCSAEVEGDHYPISEAGVWVECIYERAPVIHNDYDSLPHRKGLPPGHAPVTRELVLPIIRGKRIVAVLGVGNKASNYGEKDIENTRLLADFSWEIVERKRMEEALRESEKKYRLLVESLNEGIWHIDQDAYTTFVNPRMAEMLGYRPEEMMGRHLFEFMDERGVEIATRQLERRRQGIQEQHDFEFLRKDDRRIHASLEVTPHLDDEGNYIGTVAAVADISARVQAEEQLRTSLREKKVLLREIHHRVKNNLQIVSALLDFQADATGDPDVQQAFTESQNRIRSMARIHEQLYQAGDLAHIEMDNYLCDLVAGLTHSYAAHHLTTVTKAAGVTLSIDQAMPCGLLVNELVSNAMKHAFPGGRAGQIDVALHPVAGGLELTVSDDGVGLPVELDPESPGSLGLRLVEMFTRQLKGTLTLDRGKERGTTFRITFPAL